jgi:GSH-dependent disulfide-bond oxidoreductase
MIQLYFWTTPNAYKISILLEELEMPYRVIPIHIGRGEQFAESFLKISPNNKIPTIVDDEGLNGEPYAIFESGAILIYLANKVKSRLLPAEPEKYYSVLQWLMFQMGSMGPMLGQAHHFRKYAPEQLPYAIDRYTKEATRLYGVMDQRLSKEKYFAGNEYSIADIAIYPWLRAYKWQGQDLNDWPNIQRWYSDIRARPAVQRGLAVLAEKVDRSGNKPSGERWENLFGERQFPKSKENK